MNKFQKATSLIEEHYKNNIAINLSPSYGYRSRCEFGYKNNFYTMYSPLGDIIYLDTFKVARPSIQALMPKLLNQINKSNVLKTKLFQINFRSNRKNRVLVSLIYHKLLDDKIKGLADKIANILDISINLRSKNNLYSTHCDLLEDDIENLETILYQTDQSFYQPNYFHMPEMVTKAMSFIKDPKDLLELYCGSGTFSLPMRKLFNKIFATENNRQSIRCLNKSIDEQNIKNIFHARLSAEEVSELFAGRVFKRMNGINISDFNFSHVLVDPPRAGLDKDVISLISKFKNIIYISCNYETYERDVKNLKGFTIKNIEIFDQFPNTKHLEIVSLLSRE
ncbi:MAG: tRNA (uridine(54)-C5)-methyltransferase TrmA [Proteobacteria bacterium]|nr:tRNA (uridine(54)-C5)-methyltransferase TrmA [Pseudomonadota bacterium]